MLGLERSAAVLIRFYKNILGNDNSDEMCSPVKSINGGPADQINFKKVGKSNEEFSLVYA